MNLSRLITWILSLCVFVFMPFVYSTKLQDVEQSPRFLMLAIILAVCSVLNLVLIWIKPVSINKCKLLALFGIYFLINLVAVSKSINFYDGLFDFLKLSLIFSLFLIFILLFSIDKTNKEIVFRSVIISSLTFIGIAVLQLWPAIMNYLNDGKPITINYAISSSLGNKNFFSETLLLMLPITVLSIFSKQIFWRIISIVTAVLILIFLVLMQTLSTWAAGFACFVVVVVMLFIVRNRLFQNPQKIRLFTIGVLVTIILFISGSVLILNMTGASQIKSRVATFKNQLNPENVSDDILEQNSTYERLFLWNKSLLMTKDYPLMGAGMANWKILFPSYGMGTALYMSSGGIRFMHPHNDYLYVSSELGLLGLLIYLSILFALIYYAFKSAVAFKCKRDFLFALLIIVGLTVYMTISLFSMPYTRFYSVIMLMLLCALIITNKSHEESVSFVLNKNLLKSLLFFSLFTASVSIYIGSTRLNSDLHLSSALIAERKNNIPEMKSHLDQIDEKYFPLDFTATPVSWYKGFAYFYNQDIDNAFKQFKKAELINPNHLMLLNDLGTCYNLKGDAKTAEKYYQHALSISPVFGEAIINLSIVYYNAGDLDKAYITLINHRGKIKPRSVPVFATILSAMAVQITGKDELPPEFVAQLKNEISIMNLLIRLNEHKSRLEDFL